MTFMTFMTFMTHGNVTFDILEPLEYSTCQRKGVSRKEQGNLWLRLNDSGHAHSAHYTIIAHSTMHPDGDGPLGVLEPVGGGAPNVRQPLLWKYQCNTVGEHD